MGEHWECLRCVPPSAKPGAASFDRSVRMIDAIATGIARESMGEVATRISAVATTGHIGIRSRILSPCRENVQAGSKLHNCVLCDWTIR